MCSFFFQPRIHSCFSDTLTTVIARFKDLFMYGIITLSGFMDGWRESERVNRERVRERETETETERQRDRETERKRERKRKKIKMA